MMQVTIHISDDDYRDMVSHLANDYTGKPVVAVLAVSTKDCQEYQK